MKESFTLWCQALPNCAQIPSMVSLHYPVCGNSSHPFAAISLSWLGFTAIVFWTGCTIVLLFVDTAGFAFGTVTSRQGRRLIIPSQFWRKCVTYSYTWHSRYSLLLTGEPHNSFILLEKRCHIWLVKVFPTANRRSTYSCLAQRNTNSVLVWLQHKLWASPSAHEPLWARGQSPWPSASICSSWTWMCWAAFPSEPRAHNVCTLLSSQILLCHKLFQLRRHAIISLIMFYFDERSRHFFGKCLLYRVRRIFISILCIFWHELCLRPRRAPGPAGHLHPFCSCSPGSGCQTPAEQHGAGFCWLTPALHLWALTAPTQEFKKTLRSPGVCIQGSCSKILPWSCQAPAGAWKEIYILLITMAVTHKHKFKE